MISLCPRSKTAYKARTAHLDVGEDVKSSGGQGKNERDVKNGKACYSQEAVCPSDVRVLQALDFVHPWSFPFFWPFGCRSCSPNCLCRPLLSFHPLPPRVHNHLPRLASQIHSGLRYWEIFSTFTRLNAAAVSRVRSVCPGEMTAQPTMGRMSVLTYPVDITTLAVRSLFPYSFS
jgi:hypothetical protein